MKEAIRINCEAKETLPFDSLEIFQGQLKKRNSEDYRKIKESILKHGFIAPFFVWCDAEHAWLLDGTGRAEALMQMKAEGWAIPDMPVVYVHCRDAAEAKEILLKITSSYGKISSKGLEEFIAGLAIDFDSLGLGVYKAPDLREELGLAPDAPKEAHTVSGDVYDIGGHRLVCGDSGQEEAYRRLMGDERAALVFTDPPYGVNIGQKNRDKNEAHGGASLTDDMANDDLDADALFSFLARVFCRMNAYMREDASYYVCNGGGYAGIAIAQALKEAGLPAKYEIIWCKNAATFSMGRNDYDYQHEKIWYGWKGSHHFYGLGKWKTTLWAFNKPQMSKLHPTMKPPELVENAIKDGMEPMEKGTQAVLNNSVKNDIILDPFGGSGTTLAAAERLKRRARLIEIEPKYCDVIVKRAMGMNPALEVTLTRGGVKTPVSAGMFE